MRTPDMEECVETEELVAMLDGKLASDRVEAVVVHVDRCALCAEVIANLARDTAARCVGRYQLGRVIGSGAMGLVHEGWDPELRRRVAVKLVRPEHSDDAARARMLREARALARISHPNVVAVHDVGEHDGEIYVATELVDGETMATWCAGRTSREIVGAWVQAARGLEAAHAGGIVHRDIKPSNVLIGRDGRVRIGDFGLARTGDSEAAPATAQSVMPVAPADSGLATVTESGRVAGTPAYMAPEQWRGVGDARADQYALSVAIVESLTRERPGPDEAVALPEGVAGREALARALGRALRKDPAARFPAIGALGDALSDAIAPPVRPRRARTVIGLAVLVAAAIAVTAWTAARRREPSCEIAAIPGELWSTERRAALETRFPAVIAAHVDAWMTAWRTMAADVCAIDAEAPVIRDRRERCLGHALAQSRNTLARWDRDPETSALPAQIAIELLPRPAACTHDAAVAAIEPTQAQAFAISALRGAMDLELYVVKRHELAVVRDVARQALAVGHAPFVVETELELARQLATSDRDAAVATLRDALARADQVHDDRSRARAATALISMLGADRIDEAVAIAETARADLTRLGGEPALEHDLDIALAGLFQSAQRRDEAIAALERARRNARQAWGPDSSHEARALVALETAYNGGGPGAPGAAAMRDAAMAIYRNLGLDLGVRPGSPVPSSDGASTVESTIAVVESGLVQLHRYAPGSDKEADALWAAGNAHYLAGHLDRALELHRRAAALYDHLEIRTSSVVDAHAKVALLLQGAGQLHEALREADRATALATAIDVKSDLGFSLTIQGELRIALGDLAGARAVLERALQLRLDTRAGPTQLGNTQFQYARALWQVDRRLAVDFATSARVLIRSYVESDVPDLEKPYIMPMQKRRFAEIDRWLAEHPAPRSSIRRSAATPAPRAVPR